MEMNENINITELANKIDNVVTPSDKEVTLEIVDPDTTPRRRLKGEELRDKIIEECSQNVGNRKETPQEAIMEKLIPIYHMALSRGANPIYTPEDLKREISAFFVYMHKAELRATKTALRTWLGINELTYTEWCRGKRPELHEIMLSANDVMEMFLQNDLTENTKASMFLLKCTHGYKESTDVNIKSTERIVDSNEVNDLVKKLGLDKQSEQ